jgi:hypothetical protein
MSSYRNLSTPKGVVINNPHTGTFNVDMTTGGIWSQLQSGTAMPYVDGIDPIETKIEMLQKQLDTQMLTINLMRLKILEIEGKFTQEEISNITKMIISEDEASRTLADSIIENA